MTNTLYRPKTRLRKPLFRTKSPVLYRISVIWLLLLLVLAIFGPLIAPYDPNAIDLGNVYDSASFQHLFGTDESGRDIFSRALVGIGPTLAGPVLVVAISATLGTLLAIAGAWFGGFIDALISRFFDVLFAFPGLIIAILAAAFFGAGFWAPVLALALSFTPVFGRIIRSSAIRERNLPYVAAARVVGIPPLIVNFKHILPNLVPVLAVQAAIAMSYAILDLAAISYLGLGMQPPSADWGLMIAQGQNAILAGHPGQSLIVSILVLITVIAMNFIGDHLARKFEVGDQ